MESKRRAFGNTNGSCQKVPRHPIRIQNGSTGCEVFVNTDAAVGDFRDSLGVENVVTAAVENQIDSSGLTFMPR